LCELPAGAASKAAKNKSKKKHWPRFSAENKQEHGEAGTAKQGTEQSL
jgi:hypothetical protein